MQASRALITMVVVLVASAFAPALSVPLECVAVPFISYETADLFVVLVTPSHARWVDVRNENAVLFFLSSLGIGRSGPVALVFLQKNTKKRCAVTNVCMYYDSM